MVAKKRKSKRRSLQQKYKVIKRTKEHHRKLKKGVLSGRPIPKKNKENRIPNDWPYKEDLLKEIRVAKEKMEEVKQRQKEKRKEEMAKKRQLKHASEMDLEVQGEEEAPQLAKLLRKPQDLSSDVTEVKDDSVAFGEKNLGKNSRRAYLGELRKVIESADVVLQVLDARDPNGTKSNAVEEMVMANHRKKLVYVLNKADLVPREVLIGWLKYLRASHPTIPFKCNTQNQKGNLGIATGKVAKQQESSLKTNQAVGAEELLGLLKNYARVGDSKTIISVGIVGFPNVGKSSLINSLTRTRAVGVSAVPGFTKTSQEVILDKNIRLIDSPGIVFADGDNAATALRNCINVEEMEDVYTPVQAILDRCPASYLMQLYSIPKFQDKDCMSFLALVAKVTGKLKKGGIPNTDAAARGVLHDWNHGKIKYYCKAPSADAHSSLSAREKQLLESESRVVSEFSDEMNIADLREEDIRVLDNIEAEHLQSSDSHYFVEMENVGKSIDMK